jgi:photosystem II stability/assembly factor-like uncharacterized protein
MIKMPITRSAVLLAGSLPLAVLLAASAHAGGKKRPAASPASSIRPATMKQSVTMIDASIQSLVEAKETRAKTKGKKFVRSEAKGLGYLESKLYWTQLRAYPGDEWDWSRADTALAQKKRMPGVVYRSGGSGTPARAGVRGSLGPGSQVPILPDGATWEFVGPRNWDGGSITGRVNGVAIDPANSRIAYIASAGGGVWKTLDGGGNWTPLTDQKLERLHTTCIAINPRSARQVLVGLGDHHGQGNPGRGIARSLDGGNSWSIVGSNLMGGGNVSAIVYDPDIANLVIATSTSGIFRSTDGGATWARAGGADSSTPLPGGDYTSLTVAARNNATASRRYYAANRNGSPTAGIYRSDDRGQTWQRLAGTPLRYVNVPGLPLTGLEVAASPVSPDTVYFSEGEARSEDGRIWRSDQAGGDLTWTDITGTIIGDNDWYQVWYDHYLASSSRFDGFGGGIDVLYSGLFPATVSPSGNSNWSRYDPVHVDQQGIGFDPKDRNKAIVVNDGGAYSTLFAGGPTGGVNVTASLNANLGVTQFYHADWHPTNPDIMLGGTQDNSTALSQGNLFNWLVKIGGDGMSVGIVDENPNAMYGSTQQVGSVWRSTNGGTSFPNINPTAPDYADGFGGDVKPWKTILFADPILESPVFADQNAGSPRTAPVAFVATDRLWRHGIVDKDMDTSLWTERLGSTVLTNGTQGASVTCIQVVPVRVSHPNNPGKQILTGNVVYVGSSDGAVWMTRNAVRTGKLDGNGVPVFVASAAGDVTWQKLNAPGAGTPLPAGSIASISVNPADPFDVLVGIGGEDPRHLWRCANTRSAWNVPQTPWVWTPQSGFQGTATALPDAIVVGITRDPQDPQNTYYVATDFGVFGTVDGGSTWADVGKAFGLPNVEVTTIEAVPATGYLNIATFGRGLWRIPLADKSGFALNISAGVVRNGNNLDAAVTIANPSDINASNVRITQASMRTERTNVNVNTSTPLPQVVSPLLSTGDTAVGNVRFANGALTSGTFVNLKVTVQATVNGSLRTFVQTLRLRLP